MGKGNIANLKPFTKENAKEMGKKGGQKFAENQRERKTLKEAVEKAIENKYGRVSEILDGNIYLVIKKHNKECLRTIIIYFRLRMESRRCKE